MVTPVREQIRVHNESHALPNSALNASSRIRSHTIGISRSK